MPHASSMTLNVCTTQESRAERAGSGQEDGGAEGSPTTRRTVSKGHLAGTRSCLTSRPRLALLR
jgi:hypothetical protein